MNSVPWFLDWRELNAYLQPRANSFNLVETLKDFEILHEFNYFISLSAMISFGHNHAAFRVAKLAYSVDNWQHSQSAVLTTG